MKQERTEQKYNLVLELKTLIHTHKYVQFLDRVCSLQTGSICYKSKNELTFFKNRTGWTMALLLN